MNSPQLISTADGLGQRLRFHPEAIRNRHSANFRNGDDIQLHIGVRNESGILSIVVNDQLAGKWGKAVKLNGVSPDETAEILIWFGERRATVIMGDQEFLFREPGTLPERLSRHVTRSIEALDLVKGEPAPLPLLRPNLKRYVNALDPDAADGFVDFAYADSEAGISVLGGWLRVEDARVRWTGPLTVQIAVGITRDLVLATNLCWFDRPDLKGEGVGFLMVVEHDIGTIFLSEIHGLEVGDGRQPNATMPARIPRRSGNAILMIMDIVSRGYGADIGRVKRLVSGLYSQRETLPDIGIEIDLEHVIGIRGTGVVLIGRISRPDAIANLYVQSRTGMSEPLRNHWLERDKVAGSFMAFAPMPLSQGAETWIKVKKNDGSVGFKPIEPAYEDKRVAMQQILDAAPIYHQKIDHDFDNVMGVPLVALNSQRLERRLTADVSAFGEVVQEPRCSIIVPLYGRLDFLTYQMALFSADGREIDEIVYVLDQPERREELLALARSAHVRFGRPFRIAFPSDGRGFGPASNLGLAHARGHYVCFLNSDAFPEAPDWLDRMIASLDAADDIGIVGARLLFADGSIQHDGMELTPNDSAGGWLFPRHPDKGLRPTPPAPVAREVEAVTGACIVLTRDLINDLGGFDPAYPIGDFEDADLCARIRARGLKCVIDDQATLYHLERQSQGDHVEAWRANLTLLNAWIYQRRWVNPLL
jgi:GT2 family glycosyltransferase